MLKTIKNQTLVKGVFRCVKFDNCTLTKCILDFCELDGCTFKTSTASNCLFQNCGNENRPTVIDSTLNRCDLINTPTPNCNIHRCSIGGLI